MVDDAWDGGVYVSISGPVDVEPEAIGPAPRAAVAWAWLVHGRVGGRVEEVPFEPRVYSYALEVDHPPAIEPGEGEPVAWAGWEGSLLVGLPLLVRAEGEALDLEVAPGEAFAWLSGDQADATAVVVGDGVAAVTRDHLLLGLVGAPGDPGHGAPCGLDDAVEGLTLYRRGVAPCAPWRPLAEPGTRTEFQGVAMGAPTPAP